MKDEEGLWVLSAGRGTGDDGVQIRFVYVPFSSFGASMKKHTGFKSMNVCKNTDILNQYTPIFGQK